MRVVGRPSSSILDKHILFQTYGIFRRNHQVVRVGHHGLYSRHVRLAGFQYQQRMVRSKHFMERFRNWSSFRKLKREDKCSLVLYDADSEVTVDAFMPHMHPGGEAYLVLEERFGMMRVLTQPDQLFDGPRDNAYSKTRIVKDFDSCALARRCQSGLVLNSLPITQTKSSL